MGILLLVRHGQASFGAEDYDVLSDTGVTQGLTLGHALASRESTPSLAISGTLRRQRETAEGIVKSAGWSVPLETDARWDEFDHLAVIDAYPDPGDLTDLDRRQFQELFEKATGRWASANHDDDYAETFAAFTSRVRDALGAACRRAGSGSTVVVVSSGGVIAAAAAMLLSPEYAGERRQASATWQRLNAVMVNTSVTRVVVGSTGARLLTFNEHAHLPSGDVTYR